MHPHTGIQWIDGEHAAVWGLFAEVKAAIAANDWRSARRGYKRLVHFLRRHHDRKHRLAEQSGYSPWEAHRSAQDEFLQSLTSLYVTLRNHSRGSFVLEELAGLEAAGKELLKHDADLARHALAGRAAMPGALRPKA